MISERGPAAPSGTALPASPPAVTDLELQLLLEAVYRTTGYDFRDFAPAQLRRRVQERVRAEGATTISGLQERVLHDGGALDRLIDAVTFNPSAPFRDPAWFATFRSGVLPRLRTFPFVRIWVAGCGAADDAYALGILLREADFAHRARIYATDTCETAIERGKGGILSAAELEGYEQRYREAGGTRRFEDYLDVQGAVAAYRPSLRENMIFAQHNLATDGSFNEFHLIVARNVLGQYNRTLAYRVHQVFYESLVRLGFLGLGDSDTMRYTPHQRAYQDVPDSAEFFRRIR